VASSIDTSEKQSLAIASSEMPSFGRPHVLGRPAEYHKT